MVSNYRSDRSWTSVDSTLKEMRRIQADRRYRDERGAFFIEGVRNFVQVVDHHFDIVVIVYSEKLLTDPLARKFVRQLRRAGVPTVRLSPENFHTTSQTRKASGVGAIVSQRWSHLRSTALDTDLCWLILGLVRSPGNFGTLIRTSEAIGGAGFILLDRTVDPYFSITARGSMGALFRQHFVRTNCQALKSWATENRCQVIGASPDGATDFHQFTFPRTTLLFLGEERQGLTPGQRSLCDHMVRIPMVGQADSLNLGVAGSLLMYEVYRSRSGP